MTKKNRFESSDGDVTYLSYGEAVDDDAVLLNGNGCRRSVVVNGGVSLIRSRSESNLSIASSVFPSRIGGRHVAAPLAVAVAPTNTLHKCLRVLGGSWKNLFHRKLETEDNRQYFDIFGRNSIIFRPLLRLFGSKIS